jgi:hypothetical protein
MKKFILLCLIGAFVMTSTVLSAQEKVPLGAGNVALKVDYIAFTEDDLEDADSGLYLGLEGMGEVTPNLYLGFELGYAVNIQGEVEFLDRKRDVDLTYMPVELNLKYAPEVSPHFLLGVGAGISYNYAKIDVENGGDLDDGLFGGQFFVDLNYTFDRFFFGVNGKYQITEEGDNLEVSFDNWRIGGQIGGFF